MTTQTVSAPRASTSVASAAPIPFARICSVEIRKLFNTRSGFWLLVSVGGLAVLATGAVIAFAPQSELTQGNFSAAVGFPLAIVLPLISVLTVTNEYTQRTGLTTFTLIPQRGRVLAAKATVSVAVAVISMVVATGIGAAGNAIVAAAQGFDAVWDVSASQVASVVLANVLGTGVGFAIAVLLRSTPAAVVGYLIFNLVIPSLTGLLSATQDWFATAQPWVDMTHTMSLLTLGFPSGVGWAQLATSTGIWLVVPLVIGVRGALRTEIK